MIRLFTQFNYRDKIIPHAIYWYTGDTVQEHDFEGIEDDEEFEDDDVEKDDDEDDDSEDEYLSPSKAATVACVVISSHEIHTLIRIT